METFGALRKIKSLTEHVSLGQPIQEGFFALFYLFFSLISDEKIRVRFVLLSSSRVDQNAIKK